VGGGAGEKNDLGFDIAVLMGAFLKRAEV